MRDKYILGINMGLHDSSAAILRNGELIAIGEQERFSRNKGATNEAPIDAIKFCLKKANISLNDVNYIGLGSDLKLLDKWHGLTEEEKKNRIQLDDPNRLFPKDQFDYNILPEIISFPHHLAHASSAFSLSGFEEAAILVVDNRGEHTSTTLYYGKKNSIVKLEEYDVQDSLGLFYRAAAQYAGVCGKHRTVGKLMGLAPYGKATEKTPIVLKTDGYGFDELENLNYLRGIEQPLERTKQLIEYFKTNCYPYTVGLSSDIMAYSNFAASVQAVLESVLFKLCEVLKERTNCTNLVIAGGVGLNCSANGKIAKSKLFENIFIQPMAGDAGVAIGAAYQVVNQYLCEDTKRTVMEHAYWGEEYSDNDILEAIKKYDLEYKKLECGTLSIQIAKELANNKIIGWFQGRAEVGPRALGARSLLGNPRNRETLVRLNNIKGREMWRPLAPSILEEEFSNYFEGPHASPFMIVATSVKPSKRNEIPATVHIDGSARPQIVKKNTNKKYWNLIREFKNITNTPVVVNTSFNVAGEPIVHTPENAIDDFLNTNIDVLVMNNFVISKY